MASALGLGAGPGDGELAVSLYQRWGLGAAKRMAGPFSWVIVDHSKRRLVAVADRAGAHRLYYTQHDGTLFLGYDVESLIDASPKALALNRQAAALYLCGAPLPLDASFYEEIRALTPGDLLIADTEGARTSPYWRLAPGRELELDNDEEYVDALWERMRNITTEYCTADDFGVALSGGVDSPTVAVLLRSLAPSRRGVALRLVAPEHGDSEPSRVISEQLGFEDNPIEVSRLWPLSAATGLAPRRGSPEVPIFSEVQKSLCAAARDAGVGVLFTGWGGDELFGGDVEPFADLLVTRRWRELRLRLAERLGSSPPPLTRAIVRAAIRPTLGPFLDPFRHHWARAVPWLQRSSSSAYRQFLKRLGQGPRIPPARRRRWRLLSHPGSVQILAPFLDTAWSWGVDVRSPLTDHRLKEFAVRLPVSLATRGGERKWILREGLRRSLPTSSVAGLGKRRAVFLAERGLRERATEQVWTLLRNMRAEDLGLVDGRKLRRYYREYLAGRHEDPRFWSALTFEAWLRQHF